MSYDQKIHELLNTRQKIDDSIRKELIELVDQEPENDECENISSDPHCFTVSAKTAFEYGVLRPEFYDFKKQWQTIQTILRNGEDLGTQMKRINDIIETGKLRTTVRGTQNTFTFHPHVLARLREILRSDGALTNA